MTGSSVEVPESGDCAFCDYLDGRRPYTVLARGQLTALLVTREQRGISHLLAIPVAHRPTLLNLADAELGALMLALREAARVIAEAERPSGIAVWQNNGVSADQKIPHLHFHVAGVPPEGATERGAVAELAIEETERIAARLRRAASLHLE